MRITEIATQNVVWNFDIEHCRSGRAEFHGEQIVVDSEAALLRIGLLSRNGERRTADGISSEYVSSEIGKSGFCARYSFFGGELEAELRVEVNPDKDELTWRVEIFNRGNDRIEWVEYAPVCVNEKLKKDGGQGAVLWPMNEGVLISKYADKEDSMFAFREPTYPSEGSYAIYPNMAESQFLAYVSERGGIYLGAHDKNCGTKWLDFVREDGAIRIFIRAYTESGFGGGYRSEYDTVVKLFDGEWQDAADIYRDWFFSDGIGKTYTPIAKNKKLPEWYKKSPLVIAYPVRGRHDTDEMTPNEAFPYENALPFLDKFAEETEGPVMALVMHWEGTAPWAPPYVWPPYGGEKMFRDFADKLHERGNYLGVYCSGTGWTKQSKLIAEYNGEAEFESKNMQRIMCRGADGKLKSVICPAQRTGYDMCPACEETGEILSDQMRRIASAGVDYIQALDQNHGGNGYFCYDTKHGHAAGPGAWQMRASRALMKKMSEATNGALLGCESAAADCFLDLLPFSDNRFELNRYAGDCVPLYAYLYHEIVNNFMGNQVCLLLDPSPLEFFYRTAYSFAAGDVPTVVVNGRGEIMRFWGQRDFSSLPDREKAVSFLRQIGKWRRGFASKYLLEGRMTKPEKICEKINYIPVFRTRDDIAAPELLSSRWLAKDGKTGQIVINYNLSPRKFTVNGTINLYRDPDSETAEKASGEIEVPALSAVLFER